MCGKTPVYVAFATDELKASDSGGGVRTTVVTPTDDWGLPFGMSSVLIGLRLADRQAGFGITLKWQWSFDGVNWNTGATIGQERTNDGDYAAIFSTPAEMSPFGRVIAEVRDTGATAQKTGVCSIWAYFKYE